MKKKEIIFIAAILFLAAGSYGVMQFLKPESYKSVTIRARGEIVGTYSLDENQEIEINGTNVAEIENGQIYMKKAKCPDQLCLYQSAIGKNGGLIVCLPNEVMIEGEAIESDETENQFDSVVK